MNLNCSTMISVIIPVYNGRKYLERCLKSVIEQTYENIEIILIDDGSIDGTFDLCDQWEKKDERIKVIHQSNEGVSMARNKGIELARGKYLTFIDADDYIKNNYIETLYLYAVQYDADIVCSDYISVVNGVPNKQDHHIVDGRVTNSVDDFLYDYENNIGYCSRFVWGKLIRYDIAQNLRFKKMQYGEDTVYMINLLKTNPIIYLSTYSGYFYIRNSDSASQKAKEKNINIYVDHLLIGKAWVELAELGKSTSQNVAINLYAKIIYTAITFEIRKNNMDLHNYSYICKHVQSILNYRKLKIKYRMVFKLYKKKPTLLFNMRIFLLVTDQVKMLIGGKNK